jgi:Ca2+-binding EF-hand superfamily protein
MKTKTLMIAALVASVATATLAAKTVFAEGGGHDGKRSEMMEKRMKAADTNGDGTISKAEFVKQAEERFEKIDANNDGGITKEEMEAMREKFHKARQDAEKPATP